MSDREPLTTYSSSGRRIALLNSDDRPVSQPQPGPSTSMTAGAERQSPASASPTSSTKSAGRALAGEGRSGPQTKRVKAHIAARAEALVQRRYVCPDCDKAFSTGGHLTRHLKVHTGEKPFICPYPRCYKKCSREDNLVQHFRVHIPKEDRKLGQIYFREAIAAMQRATDVSSAVLLLAGLPPPADGPEGADTGEERSHRGPSKEDGPSPVPSDHWTPPRSNGRPSRKRTRNPSNGAAKRKPATAKKLESLATVVVDIEADPA